MSEIQKTENTLAIYSPEWFHAEAETTEYVELARKANEFRENFIYHFGIEQLKRLSGKDLLTSLFYNDEGNKSNLCYMLEMDRDLQIFGGISGGSAYYFQLY